MKAGLAQFLVRQSWEIRKSTGSTVKPWPWADTYPAAVLSYPENDIELFVLSGISGRTLAFGPGHMDGTAKPGENGNCVIAGHRDTSFWFLKDIKKSNKLIIGTMSIHCKNYGKKQILLLISLTAHNTL